MNIGLYNPYLDSYGGGERYVFTLAGHWSKVHDVRIFWDDASVLSEAQKRFDLNLKNVKTVPNIFAARNLLRKLSASTEYDCIFFLSDGSVPTSLAKYNILHFQVPFAHVHLPWWKAGKYQRVICNSEFTQKYLDPSLSIQRSVVYPPVDIERMNETVKTNTILSVGRFSALYGAKKHEVLLQAFRKAQRNNDLAGWKMVIAGGLLPSDRPYLHQLKTMAKGLPVEFYANCTFRSLQSLYGTASIYWHAAGVGFDPEKFPEKMEHFGITTIEAMSAGCVPVVYAAGGQTDIVENNKSGYLWRNEKEFLTYNLKLVNNMNLLTGISKNAVRRAAYFSYKNFKKRVHELV